MQRLYALMAAIFMALPLLSQSSAFLFKSFINPSDFTEVAVDEILFRKQLDQADRKIKLPLPNGEYGVFTATESSVFSPELAARYPGLRSYRVAGPWGTGRVAVSPQGVDALLRGPKGTFAIQPAADRHQVFYTKDFYRKSNSQPLACGYVEEDPLDLHGLELGGTAGKAPTSEVKSLDGSPRELRQYDLVLTCTGEFADQVGGSREDVMAAYNVALSTVNAIFEREFGVRMNLLAVSENLIFLSPSNDPYIDADVGTELLSQVLTVFNDANIPSTAYDLGHVFTGRCNDVGGVVSGRACTSGKTEGVTCYNGSGIARMAERILAHEIAHQFAVSHTWNNCPGSLEQRAGSTAFEPGSGTTIMSYAGTCGTQNIGAEDAYYHVGSLEQFLFYTRQGSGRGCATVIETENISPTVSIDYENGFFIPKNTPFVLTGTATDTNGDSLTYNWDQVDLGPVVDIRTEPEGNAPLFRSVPPSPDGATRYFPRIDRVANGIRTRDEQLPDYGRAMTFRLVVRDNHPEAGAVEWAEVAFRTSDAIGPFTVNEPDFGDSTSWRVGEYREVTWDVANTDKFPINTQRVDILLSGDGGITFDQVLASDEVNDGSAFISVPDTLGDAMRIIVRAADNIFFNMNGDNFSIQEATQPAYTLTNDLSYREVCLPEIVAATLQTGSILGFSTPLEFSVDTAGLPEGLALAFDRDQVAPGEAVRLTLNLENVNTTSRIIVPVTVIAEGVDTLRQEITLDVIANDFSDLFLTTPEEGTTGIVLSTSFNWAPSGNADTYDFQLATSPSFAPNTLIASANGLGRTSFQPEDFFASNTLYFWRVRPNNSCGPGAWLPPASFRTENSACTTLESTDTPVSLPGSGRAFTRESVLSVTERATISDLNLPNVRVRYQFVSNMTLTLESPAGTRVELYRENCFSTNLINLGFDDEAPENIACPPDDQRVFMPTQNLAAFNGEDTFGDWKLELRVSETGGSSGNILDWAIEFCADVNPRLPSFINNVNTEVQPLGRQRITFNQLQVTSEGLSTSLIYYILTRVPAAGDLYLNDRLLVVGDTISQADIDQNRVVYEHTVEELEADDFSFVVTNSEGGYLPGEAHGITVTEDAISSTREVSKLARSLEVFPNPTDGDLNLRWSGSGNQAVRIGLFDANGRQLYQGTAEMSARSARVPTAELPAGIYFLRVDGAVRRVIRKRP